ncbi:oxidoreductase [Aquipuribacter nitratireducens]|uniref:Oxidoreductase n=1 Tax=Aquipuribacter nitratireducens TaxID=650104 RepID=A0ABW0GHM0_9MICO
MARWTLDDAPRQDGRLAVVTGGNDGLGLETALSLATLGARVVLACRTTAKGEAAATRIRERVPGADVTVRRLDLASLASVEAFAADLLRDEPRLDLLIDNAGIMAVDEGRTEDGFELQLGTNHLGHFALTLRLLPALLATPGSRVATISSVGHRRGRLALDDLMGDVRGYDRWRAYFQSKLANLLFTAELQRRLAAVGAGTIAVAAHPGGSRTDLGTEGTGLSNRLSTAVAAVLTQSARVGALPMLRAAVAPDVVGGEYYGPRLGLVGHPVRETPSRRARDADDAAALWEASERLTGVTWAAVVPPARDLAR